MDREDRAGEHLVSVSSRKPKQGNSGRRWLATVPDLARSDSLADNDDHVLRAIVKGNAGYLLVSLYGNPDSSANKAIIEKAEKLVQQRGPAKGKRQSLKVIYYDASSAKVWG